MPNIGFLISHIAKSDPHLYQALSLLAGNNAPNMNIFTAVSDVSQSNLMTLSTSAIDIPKTALKLNINGNYEILASLTMSGDQNTGALSGLLNVEGTDQPDLASAYVGAGGVFTITITQHWKLQVTSITNLKLRAFKSVNAGNAFISQAKLTATLLP
jgi:hypothetical protein